MKTTLLTALAVGVLLITACEKETWYTFPLPQYGASDESPAYEVDVFYPGDTTKGISEALKNGTAWKAGGKGISYVKNNIQYQAASFKTYAIDRLSERETLGFQGVPDDCQGKTYIPKHNYDPLNVFAYYIRAHSDGDVFLDRYILDTTATDNFIRIDRLDRGRKLMQGAYSLTFKIVLPRKHPSNPLQVKFSEGRFGVKF